MKKNVTLIVFLLSSFLNAQVGIGTETPDNSSVLDITSNNSGVLIPRLSTAERDNDVSMPATGLLIFNTDENRFQYNFGTKLIPQWINLSIEGNSIFQDKKGYVLSNGASVTDSGISILKTGVGIYQVNFETPAPNSLYSVIATTDRVTGTDDLFIGISNRTTNNFEIRISDEDDGTSTNAYVDNTFSFYISFFASGSISVVNNSLATGYVVGGTTPSFSGIGMSMMKVANGHYRFTFDTPQTDINYVVNLTPDRTTGTNDIFIGVDNRTLLGFDVFSSIEDNGGTTDDYIDIDFSVIVN